MTTLYRYLVTVLALNIAFQVMGTTLVRAQDPLSGLNAGPQHRQEVTDLFRRLREASEREQRDGQTIVDEHGQRLFTGTSAARMENLHNETLKRVDELIARPESQRSAAESAVAAFIRDAVVARGLVDGGKAVAVYQRTARSSYNRGVPVEVYYAGATQFEVNAVADQIIQFGPRPQTEVGRKPVSVDLSVGFGQAELANIASRFLARRVASFEPHNLEARVSNKEGLIYFFRWEDPSRDVEGLHPFVQVGLTRNGEVVSYTNTLDLPDSVTPASAGGQSNEHGLNFVRASFRPLRPMRALRQGATGVWIFANNGSYYTEYGPSNYWWTTYNEGYCSNRIASWCNPKHMRYTYETMYTSNYASWGHPYGGWGTHKVFIPRVNATTRWASYLIIYSGGSNKNFTLDQLVYSDVWVPTYTLYNMSSTWLYDSMWGFQSPTGKKVGFDEIQIVY